MADQSPPIPHTSSPWAAAWRVALLACLTITVWRVVELFANPINLSFDEAQYWGWAQQPDWGYFSKPPMVAWAIWLTTALGGSNAEPWVRLSAPISHLISALSLFGLGRLLAPPQIAPRVALWSALAWIVLPGVTVSAMIISTDALLLMFWALALLSYCKALHPETKSAWPWWLLTGLWIGLGTLSKYAMVYFVLGAVIHLLWDPRARAAVRQAWGGPLLAMAVAGLIYLPNWLWNRANGFASYHHTSENANLSHGNLFSPIHLAEFIGSQFGVFGPILFAAFLLVVLWKGRALVKGADPEQPQGSSYRLLLAFSLPPLLLITVQAFLSRANANWAATAYVAATPLVVMWLVSLGKTGQRWLVASLALHLVISVVLYDLEGLARKVGVSEPARYDLQKRVRGWDDAGEWLRQVKQDNPGMPLLYVDRKVLASMLYYARPEGWDSIIYNPDGHIMNHYELTTSMNGREGKDFLLVTRDPPDAILSSHFDNVDQLAVFRKMIHPKYTLTLYVYKARGFKGYAEHG